VSAATLKPPAANPLSPEHHRELAFAAERAKPIYRAARVAAMNGWITGIIAACSAPFALYDLTGAVMTVGLAVVAYNEFRGRKRLLAFDPSGATVLGRNQMGLMGLLVGYCLWMMYSSLATPSPMINELTRTPEVKDALADLGDLNQLYQSMVIIFYGVVILLSVIFQGINALYYFSRRRLVADFVAQTPEWVRDVQRAKTAL